MSKSSYIPTIMGNEQYEFTREDVRLVRDSIEGEPALKQLDVARIYLPDPSDNSLKSGQDKESKIRYLRFLREAEYDNFPDRTLSGYLGALFSKPVNIEGLPDALSYMIDDSDGDGLSLQESMEITSSNMIQLKYHGLLTSYEGAIPDSESPEGITKERAKALGLKATIKHYPRESIVDWDYSVVDGVKQLTFVKLFEREREIDMESLVSTYYDVYIVLALDSEGNYYQEKITTKVIPEGNSLGKIYPEVRGSKMRYIPFEIAIDQKQSGLSIPRQLGVLYPVCKKAIYRYQVNAKLKETMRITGQPTTYSSGWTEEKAALFKSTTGLDTVRLGIGSHMPLPQDVELGFLQWDANSDPMFKYLEQNEKAAKALGARFNTSDSNTEAVGVAEIRSAEELSVLVNIASSCEEAYRRSLGYAYQMMTDNGDLSDIEEFNISINREFNRTELTPAQEKQILDSYTGMLISKEEALRRLEKGGVSVESAENILQELSNTMV